MRVTRKNKDNRTSANETGKVTISLDARTLAIWNRRKRSGENMSLWVRTQLEYHFGAALSPDAKLEVLREEVLIAQKQSEDDLAVLDRERDSVAAKWQSTITSKASDYARLKEELVAKGLVVRS